MATRIVVQQRSRTLPTTAGLALLVLSSACSTTDPVSGLDFTSMDTSVDPCVDFYTYACGGFIRDHAPAPTSSVIRRRSTAENATTGVEAGLFTKPPPNDAAAATIGAYYRTCVEAGPGTQPHDELTRALATMTSIASPADLARAVAISHSLGATPLFWFGNTENRLAPRQHLASIAQSGVGLPDPSFYSDPSPQWIAAYRDHITRLSALLGDTDAGLPDAVVRIETALASAMMPADQKTDRERLYNLVNLADFEASVPHFDWPMYLASASAPTFTTLDVQQPGFFGALETLVATTPLADLSRYLRFRLIEAFARTLGDDVIAEESRFHDAVFYGISSPLPREERCRSAALAAMPWTASRYYVTQAFSADTGVAATALSDEVRAAFKAELEHLSWLDDPTRAAALNKLSTMKVMIGAPDHWPNNTVSVHADSYAATVAGTSRSSYRGRVQGIGATSGAPGPWFMPPNMVNAQYSGIGNAVNVPAGFLQDPLFDLSHAPAVNAGNIGVVFGHEMTHGFDANNRHLNPDGAWASWWTPTAEQAFLARTQCLVDQYSAFEIAPGLSVNGALTLNENIADFGGIRHAYDALAPSGEASKHLANAQVFFLAYAQGYCESARPERVATMLRVDTHAPVKARINVVLANMPEFAAAYACPAGTPMVADNRCELF